MTSIFERLEQRDGRLGWSDRLRITASGALARMGWWGLHPRGVADLAVLREGVQPPRSPAVAAAAQLVVEVSAPWLVAHCHRTWAWAAAFGVQGGIDCDRELLYLAALLHDLGLTEAYAPPPGQCFAVTGAREARRFSERHGIEPRRAARIAEAIALHLEVRVALADGREAHLLQAGAACDVIGARTRELPSPLVDEVCVAHPRGTIGHDLPACLVAQAQASPATRMGLYCRSFGFAERAAATTLGQRA